MKEIFQRSTAETTQPDSFHEQSNVALLELAADLPQVMAEFTTALEKSKTRPAKEIDGYYLSDPTQTIFYAYPREVKEYLDLYGCTPEIVKISRGMDTATHGSLHQLAIEIGCDNGSLISITCPADAPLDETYTLEFIDNSEYSSRRSCTPGEISTLLSSIVLSPDQLSDVDERRRNGETVDDINPRSPFFQQSLNALLEDKADDFSSSQTYHLTLDQSGENDGDVQPSFVLKVDQYANGASAYDISVTMGYADSTLEQESQLHTMLEVHDDGSLVSIISNGTTVERSHEATTHLQLDSATVASTVIGLLSVKSQEINAKQVQL